MKSLLLVLSCFWAVQASYLTAEEVIARGDRRQPRAAAGVAILAHRDADPYAKKGKILGGTPTTIEEYPHQVAVLINGRLTCGGSIISHSWVLTAAQCLDTYPFNSDITIRTGSTSSTAGGTIHETFYYHLHEDYDPIKYTFDVATIRVRTPMTGGQRTAIPLATAEWILGGETSITGWGRLTSEGETTDILRMVAMPIIDRAACNEAFVTIVSDDMICAGGANIDACRGDGGGAAIRNGIQYGIISWGSTTCGDGSPLVFTNIAHPSIRDFIRRTTLV